jgi:predicted transcriptional regulator
MATTTKTPKKNGRRKPRGPNVKNKPPPTAITRYEIRERRYDVQQLRLSGMTLSKIAEKLNISLKTAQRDLEAVQAENVGSIALVQQQTVLADTMARHENVEQTVWEEYRKPDLTPGQRLRALDMVRTIVNDKLKVLMDTGLVHKAESESTVKHVHQLDWSPEMQDAVAQSLIEQSLTTPLLEPVPDTYIDVETTTETATETDDDGDED